MLSDIVFSYKNGIIISYLKDGRKDGVPYSSIKKIWNTLTIDSIEGWIMKTIDNLILFTITVAQGQGGGLFVWDTDSKEIIHYSEASYCEDFLMTGSSIITMNLVSNYVSPYHIQLWMCDFGTKNMNYSGKRLYCKKPVPFDQDNTWQNRLTLRRKDNQLFVIAGDRQYLYSDDMDHLVDQKPNSEYSFLYKNWDSTFDPQKNAICGMIT